MCWRFRWCLGVTEGKKRGAERNKTGTSLGAAGTYLFLPNHSAWAKYLKPLAFRLLTREAMLLRAQDTSAKGSISISIEALLPDILVRENQLYTYGPSGVEYLRDVHL